MDLIFLVVYLFVFILGLCIGSFLNCAIYRLEEKEKITGRSFCPHCKHILYWQDLFPVFSFLFLTGKCRYCKQKISIQYPLVEIATAILFILLFSQQHILQSVFYLLISCFLIIIFVYDFKHYIIPDKILWPAVVISLIYNLLPPYDFWHIFYTLLAVVISAGFFLAIFLFSKGK